MSVITVRSTVEYMAINANDENAQEILDRWFKESHPDAPEDFQLDLSGPREYHLWFLRHPSGDVVLVPAADFAKDFEEFDSAAAFALELGVEPEQDVPNLPAE